MAAYTFDTLRIAQALRDAGFDNGQAEAIVSAIQRSLGENVATKTDLAELRSDIYRALWVQGASLLVAIGAVVSVVIAITKAVS